MTIGIRLCPQFAGRDLQPVDCFAENKLTVHAGLDLGLRFVVEIPHALYNPVNLLLRQVLVHGQR